MESEEDEVRMLLSHHRAQILRELKDTQIVPVLVDKLVISASDEVIVNGEYDLEKKCNHLIDYVSRNGFEKFKQFCYAIEDECPKLIEDLIQDRLKHNSNIISECLKMTKYFFRFFFRLNRTTTIIYLI